MPSRSSAMAHLRRNYDKREPLTVGRIVGIKQRCSPQELVGSAVPREPPLVTGAEWLA